MYLDYATFQKFFPNVELTEDQFNAYEPVAEASAWRFIGKVLPNTESPVQYAIGLIVQNLYALGRRPQDLPVTRNEGGVTVSYKQAQHIIPEEAQGILREYIDIYV